MKRIMHQLAESPIMRPEVLVNCAMSPDGKIATKERRQVRISSEEDRERVRKLRSSCGAILVGVGTILADDPHLTVKGVGRERNPLRVVLDPRGRTPDAAMVLDDRARTLIVTLEGTEKVWTGAETFRCGRDAIDLDMLMAELERRGVERLMVEGGGETIWRFFKAGLVDRYFIYIGDRVFGGREAPSPVDGDGFRFDEAYRLRLVSCQRCGTGVLLSYEAERDG